MPATMDTTPHRGYPIPNADPDDLVPQIQAMIDAVDSDVNTITGGAAAALDDPGSNGIVVRTSVSVTVARSLANASAGITWTNADGVSGNPTPVLANDLAALEGLSGTGFAKRTGIDAWSLSSSINLSSDVSGSLPWASVDKSGSSLADLATRSAADLSSGTLLAARMPALTGDITTSAGAVATTLATVNSNVGTFGSATQSAQFTVNGKGLITAAANVTITPAIGSITGLGSGVAAFLGTPSSANLASAITDETGSGALVFATSPTIVTPNIAKLANLTSNGFIKTSGGDGTLSVDTASYVPTTRTLTAGNGLTGGGDLSADRTLTLGTPSTLTVSTSNSASGTTHSHAITSSSNPGAAASLLASDSSGYLTVVRLTATDYLFASASTANIYLKDTSTGFQASSTTVITPQANNSIRSTSYTSGLVGWTINASGSAEFDNVDIRGAIHAGIFTYNAINVTAGSQVIAPSAAKLKSDVTVTASPTYGTTTFTIDTVDSDGLTHAASQLFAVNDIIRLKDGMVGDTWFKVTAVSDQTTFWRYTASIQAGTANVTYRAGQGIPDYKQSGAGSIILTADQTNAPYIQMGLHDGTFSSADASGSLNITPRLRIGNLNGSYGYVADVYGFGTGNYGAASKTWVTVEQTNGLRIGNNTTVLANWDVNGNVLVGQTGSGKSNTYISAGDFKIRLNTTSLFNVDTSGNVRVGTDTSAAATTNLFVSNASQTYNSEAGFVAGDILIGDNTSTSNYGNIKITGGGINFRRGVTNYIAINSTDAQFTNLIKMSGASSAIAIGSTPPTSASAGTGIWIDRTGFYALVSSAAQFKIDAVTGYVAILNATAAISTLQDIQATSTDGIVLKTTHSGANSMWSPRVRWFGGAYRSAISGDVPAEWIAEAQVTGAGGGITSDLWTLSWREGGSGSFVTALTVAPNGASAADLAITGVIKAGSGPTTLTDSAGKILSAALNTVAVAQGGTGLTYQPSARAYNSGNISIPNATYTAITCDSERWDNDTIHSTSSNTSRLTATTAGQYEIGGAAAFAAGGGNIRLIGIRLNGTTFIDLIESPPLAGGGNVTVLSIGTLYSLAAGDYVELVVYQDSGGALNITVAANYSPEVWMARIGPQP